MKVASHKNFWTTTLLNSVLNDFIVISNPTSLLLKKALKTNKQKIIIIIIIIIITSDIDIKKLFKTNRVNIAYNKYERSII